MSVLVLSIVVAVWGALGNFAALVSLIICSCLAIFFYRFTTLKISVTGEELIVGRARIEKIYLGNVEELDQKSMSYWRGVGINPSAFMALRFWVKGGVKVELKDRRDPTPYWLISSNNPAELASEITNRK